jgi:dTDP-4-amino-4,6-dideoxygalactose transaminase
MSLPNPDQVYATKKEIDAVMRVMKKQSFSTFRAGYFEGGEEVLKFELDFSRYIGVKHAISMNSCTSALHAALLALGIGKGDKVVVPAYSFASPASAVLMVGAEPVFCDIELSTFALDSNPDKLRFHDVQAIILVHLLGYPAMNTLYIRDICHDYDIALIEDGAQALGARFDGRMIGSWGHIGCFSFGESKQMTTLGEGGMCVTNNQELNEKLCMIRNHGECFVGSRVLGYNWRMTEAAAAMGIEQLKRLDDINQTREKNAMYLSGLLDDIDTITVPIKHKGRVYSMYDMILHDSFLRNMIINEINYLAERKVCYAGYTRPIYDLLLFNLYKKQLDNTEFCCAHSMWMPKIHPPYGEREMDLIGDYIKKCVVR